MLFLISILAAIVAAIVYTGAKKRYSKAESLFALIGLALASLIAILQFWTIIPAGFVGIVDLFGQVSDNTLKPGVNLVNPMASVIKFDARTQELKETMTVPTKEGLNAQVEISLLFSLSFENANRIYKTVGEDYVERIVLPQFRSVVRSVAARYEARALYTADRHDLAQQIESDLTKLLSQRGLSIESAPVRQVILPAGLTASIEEKLKSEQDSQRMEFLLKKEQQEADRKRIEAKGIADYQDIISKGLNDKMLKWKGIEATEKLSNSPNSKIIIIGGKDGLPVILSDK